MPSLGARSFILGRLVSLCCHAQAARAVASLSSIGEEKAASDLQMRIDCGRAALDLRDKRKKNAWMAHLQMLKAKGFEAPCDIWAAHTKFTAEGLLSARKVHEFIDLIRPWRKSSDGTSKLDPAKPRIRDLANNFEHTDEVRKLVSAALRESFFSNELSRALKGDLTETVEALSKHMLEEYGQIEDDALVNMMGDLVDPMEEILTSCRAFVVTCCPEPYGNEYYNSAKEFWTSDGDKERPQDMRSIANSALGTSLWSDLLDTYWSQASFDQSISEKYHKLASELEQEVVPVETFPTLLEVLPSWRKKLRARGTQPLEKKLLTVLRKAGQAMCVAKVQNGGDSGASNTSDRIAFANILIRCFDAIDQSLLDKKDSTLRNDIKKVNEENSAAHQEQLVLHIAQTFNCDPAKLSEVLETLQAAAAVNLSEDTCIALNDMRGFVFKAVAALISFDPVEEKLEQLALDTLDAIHQFGKMKTIFSGNEAVEHTTMRELIKSGFELMRNLRTFADAHRTAEPLELVGPLKGVSEASKAFSELPIVAKDSANRPELVNRYHANVIRDKVEEMFNVWDPKRAAAVASCTQALVQDRSTWA